MKVQRIVPGVYGAVKDGKVYHLALTANGFNGFGPKDYMAATVTEDSFRPVVVGIPLAKARKMIGAWFPHHEGVDFETVKRTFTEE